MNTKEFENPGNDYRGVTLWMLNDKLEKDELKRQLTEFHKKGIGAVIARTFMGLRTEYLSDEWMEVMHTVVDLAGELGMEVFFQAGFMPSGIPDQDPKYAHVALTSIPKDQDLSDEQTLLDEDDSFKYVEAARIHVLDMFNKEAVDDYLKGAYEDTWFANFKEEFGKTISSVWVDEPHFNPPNIPWGDVLKEEFEKMWGYKIEENIPSLFVEKDDYLKIRHHYWRTVTDLLLNGYFEQVSQWCKKHDVDFSGHLMGEDTLSAQIAFTGACMPLYEKMQIPGIDHLTMSLKWSHWHRSKDGEGVRFVLTPKQCSSAANQFGKKRILAEMYAVSSQGITFEDRKQIADWFFIHGINYRCLHSSLYGMKGRRKRFYIPHLNYQQPWWEDNRLISDYCNRISYAMHQGRFCADVLLLHPVESAYSKFSSTGGTVNSPSEIGLDIEAMNLSFCRLSERLMKIHRGFEYGDEQIMSENGRAVDGEIVIGKMKYKTIIVPDSVTLRQSTVDLLNEFMDQGGTIFAAGNLPTRIDGEENGSIKSLTERFTPVANEESALAAALEKTCTPRFKVDAGEGDVSDVFLHERELEDGTIMVFLANTNRDASVVLTLSMDGEAGVEELSAQDGLKKALPADNGGVELSFAPLESHLLIFDPAAEASSGSEKEEIGETVAEISTWNVKRNTPNALTLDYCRLKKGDGEFSDIIPVMAVQDICTTHEPFTGPITLQCEFEVEAVPGSLSIALEEPGDTAITVNGKAAGEWDGESYYMDKSFRPVDISDLVQKGTNVIEFSLDFRPLDQPKFGLSRLFANLEGTEVECFYLIGDFAVRCNPRKEDCEENVRYPQGFTVTAEAETVSGDLVDEGYPFFSGDIELSGEFELEHADGRTVISLPGLESCVTRVEINGKPAGSLPWKPFEIDITDLLTDGTNSVVLHLTNTLRGVLGPFHRPLTERQQNWGYHDYIGDFCAVTNTHFPEWWKDRSKDTDAWTEDYFFVRFGVYKPAEIVVSSQ